MTKLLEIDARQAATDFGHRSFRLRHHLVDHPLTSLDALAELADALPPDKVEHNVGDVPEEVIGGEVEHVDQTPGEIVRGIETNRCWIVLPIHASPKYQALLDELIGEMVAPLGGRLGAIRNKHGVFFLSAPDSVTPTHIDLEQGFLLQIRGTKELRIAEFPNPREGQEEIERFQAGGHRNVPALPDDASRFALEPGDGVHVPAFKPHVVKNGPAVSISLSVGFVPDATLRAAEVHSCNARLRRLGLQPKAPGLSARRDWMKSTVMRSVKRVRRPAA